MLLVGSSVGIVIPIMPYIISELGLSTGQYGIVVSSFALAKLFTNVPAAVMVEKHGRKPYLVYSLVFISMGVGGIGLASEFEHLVLCRLMTGIGVSALSTAATLTTADCSTPLNRASTMAPLMSAFAAGTAMGPVIGGVMADQVGIHSTFYLVGCIYLALTAMNNIVLTETKIPKQEFPWDEIIQKNKERAMKKRCSNNNNDNYNHHLQDDDDGDKGVISAMMDAMSQWSPLLKIENVWNVVLMNMNGFILFISCIIRFSNDVTSLPLILTNPADGVGFHCNTGWSGLHGYVIVISSSFGQSSHGTNKKIAKIGKVTRIVIGCTFLSTSMFMLPYCTEMNEVVGTCGLCWALGSAMLSTAPVSFISDKCV